MIVRSSVHIKSLNDMKNLQTNMLRAVSHVIKLNSNLFFLQHYVDMLKLKRNISKTLAVEFKSLRNRLQYALLNATSALKRLQSSKSQDWRRNRKIKRENIRDSLRIRNATYIRLLVMQSRVSRNLKTKE